MGRSSAVCGIHSALASNVPQRRFINTSSPPATDYIPVPPSPPDLSDIVQQPIVSDVVLNKLGEPLLSSIGLGGWSPSGLMQHYFNSIHVYLDLPWWAAIALGTVIVRLCMFPLVVKSQRNMVNLRNNMAEMSMHQAKIADAKKMGNSMQVTLATQRMMLFMNEKGINPLKNFLVPLVQSPVFVSTFFALRKMASLPVSSMMVGGCLWFPDLTIYDPYYALPIITTLSMYAIIQSGSDGMIVPSSNVTVYARHIMRVLPIFILPFIIKFPAAIMCYWCTSNMVALLQVLLLKSETVKRQLNIPLIDPAAAAAAATTEQNQKKQPFLQRAKSDWNDMKSAQKLQNRQQYDEMRFQRAGIGPIVKTHKTDPTQGQRKVKVKNS